MRQHERGDPHVVRRARRPLSAKLAEHGVVRGLLMRQSMRTPSSNRNRRSTRSFSAERRPWVQPARSPRLASRGFGGFDLPVLQARTSRALFTEDSRQPSACGKSSRRDFWPVTWLDSSLRSIAPRATRVIEPEPAAPPGRQSRERGHRRANLVDNVRPVLASPPPTISESFVNEWLARCRSGRHLIPSRALGDR